jgi:ferritin-like metal-binding protein YciE
MGMFFNIKLGSLDDLLLLELNDLYDGEKRLCEALPKMAEAASSPTLRQAFQRHLQETQRQVSRLEQIFVDLGKPASRETCEAMKGLIKEGSEIIDAGGSPDVKDAALISAAQRVEHYEMAGYGSARTFAQHLGHTTVARLLQLTLDEEKETDQRLTQLAEEGVNVRAESSVGAAGKTTGRSWEN